MSQNEKTEDNKEAITLSMNAIENELISPLIGMDGITPYDFMTE